MLCLFCTDDQEGDKEEGGEDEEEEEDGEEKVKLPKSTWKPPPTVPSERPKSGANKKTYFVCSQRETLTHYFNPIPGVSMLYCMTCHYVYTT